jgi:HlyD family secretion protein
MRKRNRILGIAGLSLAVLGALALAFNGRNARPRYSTAAVDRGDIAYVVGATGVMQAVTTVQVGSQVSGTIARLSADFNSVVKKGQVIARLDPSLFEARLAQSQANLTAARANVDRSKAAVDDAKQKYERAKALAAENLLPASDLESAKATYEAAVAQDRANRAAVSQAEAAVNQARVDLEHTVITAPIDGVVLARSVDVGQTVAASLQAPTLFVIANDLTRMQVNASIDEADIGRVKEGQDVSFRVDAFPEQTFAGRVEQVRLQPVTNQNVVTYNTIITVKNDDLKLMPGMTATVSVAVETRKDALRLPAVALRFRPEGFEDRRAGGQTPGGAGATGGRESGRRRTGQGGPPREPGEGGRAGRDEASGGAEARKPGRPGVVFVLGEDGKPKPARVRLGLSDGRLVEVLEGVEEGTQVVTGLDQAGGAVAAARPGASSSPNPFAPPRFSPRPR